MEENNKKFDISVVKMSQIQLPQYKESQSNRQAWIKYGDNNLFPDYLIDLSNRSALHNAILSSKVDYASGNGLECTMEEVTKDTLAYLNKPNPTEKLSEIYKKLATDLTMFGGYSLLIIWNETGTNIAEIYHLDFSKVRCSEPDVMGRIHKFYYSKDWSNKRCVPKEYPVFNLSTSSEEKFQVLYYKPYRTGNYVYPLPAYVGALNYITIDIEMANFHLSNLKNGMTPSVFINFTNGVPTEEERLEIEKSIANKFTGTDNAGKFVLTFSEGVDKAPVITPVTVNNIDKQFTQLQEIAMQNILSGHKLTSPLLAGISIPGKLGGESELLGAYQIYKNTIIVPIQDTILLSLNKIGLMRNSQPVQVIQSDPIEFKWSETVLKDVYTKDEIREEVGLNPLTNTEVTI
jgi:hypothetical protein